MGRLSATRHGRGGDARGGEKSSPLVAQLTHPDRNLAFDGGTVHAAVTRRMEGDRGRVMGLREELGGGRAISRTVCGVTGSKPVAGGIQCLSPQVSPTASGAGASAFQARFCAMPSTRQVDARLTRLRRPSGLGRFRCRRGLLLSGSRRPRQMLAKDRNGFFDLGIVDFEKSSAHPQIPAGSRLVAVRKRQHAACRSFFHGGVL
jgi:hypothetical protein